MKKVKLSKDYFEAMEYLDKKVKFKDLIIKQVNGKFSTPILKVLHEMDTIDFLNALQYGYELDISPKELIEMKYVETIKLMNNNILDDNTWYELNGRKTTIEELNKILKLELNL